MSPTEGDPHELDHPNRMGKHPGQKPAKAQKVWGEWWSETSVGVAQGWDWHRGGPEDSVLTGFVSCGVVEEQRSLSQVGWSCKNILLWTPTCLQVLVPMWFTSKTLEEGPCPSMASRKVLRMAFFL